ncbi:MAG: hypothetical protein ABIR32_02725 [Ilumatobacteraceae bacterium]
MTTVQYRVAFGKKDEAVEGSDGAELVISVAAADVGLDPTVAFMRGKLKSVGSTGALFELLKSGEVSAILQRLGTR